MLQWCAASAAGRDIVYYSFGDTRWGLLRHVHPLRQLLTTFVLCWQGCGVGRCRGSAAAVQDKCWATVHLCCEVWQTSEHTASTEALLLHLVAPVGRGSWRQLVEERRMARGAGRAQSSCLGQHCILMSNTLITSKSMTRNVSLSRIRAHVLCFVCKASLVCCFVSVEAW